MKKIISVFAIFSIVSFLLAQRNPGFLGRKNLIEISSGVSPLVSKPMTGFGKIGFNVERILTRTFGLEVGIKSTKFVQNSAYHSYFSWLDGSSRELWSEGGFTNSNTEMHAAINVYFTHYGSVAPRGLFFKLGYLSIATHNIEDNSKITLKSYYSSSPEMITTKATGVKRKLYMPYFGFGIRKVIAKRIGLQYNMLYSVSRFDEKPKGYSKGDILNLICLSEYNKRQIFTINLGLSYIFGFASNVPQNN